MRTHDIPLYDYGECKTTMEEVVGLLERSATAEHEETGMPGFQSILWEFEVDLLRKAAEHWEAVFWQIDSSLD